LEGLRRIFGGGVERVKEMPADGPATSSPSKNFPGGLQLAEDRDKTRGLSMVASQLELKRYAETARRLGELLEDPTTADFFLNADAQSGSRRSFKAELRRLIGTLPPEARQAYELTFGPRARQMLDDAGRKGDVETLHGVARRYPHTEAGYEAVYLLSGLLLDQGQPGEALLWLAQLRESPDKGARYEPMLSLLTATAALQAGQQEVARATLLALKKNSPRAVLDVGGQSRPLFADDSQALTWLAEITGASIKPASRETIAQSGPLMRSRTAEFTVSDRSEELAQGRDSVRSRGETPLPVLHPVVVGDTILTRTGGGIVAVSLKTGREVWRYPSERDSDGTTTEQMIWRDVAFGRIAVDGQTAFIVEYSYPVPGDPNQNYGNQRVWFGGGMKFGGPMFFPGGGFGAMAVAMGESGSSPGTPVGGNLLSAIDIGTQGKLLWRVGGPWMVNPQLAGAFFLGPPTPAGDRLYVMAEIQNAIHLVVFEKTSGRLVWVQKLGDIENSIYQDPFRRMAGASPVVVSGMVVCPTSCGGIVAVDIARRQLLWAYQHKRSDTSMTQPNYGRVAQLNQGGRWGDNRLWVEDGRVIATPLESEDMHCLDLKTGKVLWTRPRGASLYVACVHDGVVVTVDGRYVGSKKLANGDMAWNSSIQLPGKSRPSGRGVRSGDFYYLPLTDSEGGYDKAGQIARIDLKAGKIVEVAVSQRQFVPGNLAFHDGQFISQGAQYLEVFDQAGALRGDLSRRLTANARDAEAWARLADLERSSGKLAEAIGHLRKAYDLSPSETIRNAYAAILLDGIEAKLPNRAELSEQLARLAK
jgi:outer membrane protein assembly factor BamB